MSTLYCVKSVRIWSYSGRYFPWIRENVDQNNSIFGHFLRSAFLLWTWISMLKVWSYVILCSKDDFLNSYLGGGIILPSWFSLNNSETVKAVTLALFSIKLHFIRDICAKFATRNSQTRPSLQILSETQTGYFRFPDFWSVLYKAKLA